MKIVIVDYGMGNIKSIISALNYIGVSDVAISAEYDTLKSADKLILPGVGAYGQAMDQIKTKQLDQHLHKVVIEEKKPLLGICLGMQLLGMSSNEHGTHTGLKFIDGHVVKFDHTTIKIPHVGFNQVETNNQSRLYQGFSGHVDFYFTHSYKMNSTASINQCICTYGTPFIASFEQHNIAGVQFHPELSQHNGLKVYENFIRLF